MILFIRAILYSWYSLVRNLNRILFCLLFFLIFENSFAQEDNKITCVALVNKESVILRWVPGSIPVWQMGIKYGYIVTRYIIAKDGVYVPDGLTHGIVLTNQPIVPYSNERFDSLILSEPRASIVQDAIYGRRLQQVTNDIDFPNFLKTYSDMEVHLDFTFFICDLSPEIAKATGLQFIDNNVKPGERYAYSISIANIPDGIHIDPAVIVIDTDRITTLPKISEVKAVFLDRVVKFQWPVLFLNNSYTAYIIERSMDGINFSQISDLPLVTLSEDENSKYFLYTDSIEKNDQQLWYRIKGISPFGVTGPWSDIITGKGSPEFSAYPVIDTAEVINNTKIVLKWRVSVDKTNPITGINVLRSGSYDGEYEVINKKPLSPGERSFTDNIPGISNYYQVMLLDKNNLKSFSFPYYVKTEDNIAPMPPEMLTGKVDSSGQVTIAWKENSEPDLLGYKIFRANTPTDDFIPLDREIVSNNLCYDTINLNTLTHKIYYQIVAVDKSYNSSGYSEILELTRPDTIKPSSARITNINANKGKVTIQFECSPSNDISYYYLTRTLDGDSIYKIIAKWKNNNIPDSYEDDQLQGGKYYNYSMYTTDFSGNRSECTRTIYVPEFLLATVNLNAEQNEDGKAITLFWELPDGFSPKKTIIYRSVMEDPICIYTTLNGSERVFIDRNIEINKSYNYRVKVINKADNSIISSKQLFFKPID
jgi:uncharacterized protein